jgi:hypothetical protein
MRTESPPSNTGLCPDIPKPLSFTNVDTVGDLIKAVVEAEALDNKRTPSKANFRSQLRVSQP